MYKIIYCIFVFAFISIGTMAKNTNFANPSSFLNHKNESSADTIYSCTMHPEVKSLQPGKCSKCEMDLVPNAYVKIDSTKSSVTVSTEDYYTCTMHPEVHADKPGNCPKCGMELVKKSETSTSKNGMMGMGMMMDSPWFIGIGIIMLIAMALHFVK